MNFLPGDFDLAKNCMSQAATECKDHYNSNITVSCDGTWQRRGHQSKNGISTCLSVVGKNCEVFDYEIKTKICLKCKIAGKRLKIGSPAHQKWYDNHLKVGECHATYSGTAGSMESQGMLDIFQRSQAKHGLNYTGYLGDGDSKSFAIVSAASLYDEPIVKYECCGHVQKRMFRRLEKAVNQHKGQDFVLDGKSVW